MSELADRIERVTQGSGAVREAVEPAETTDAAAALDALRDGLWPILRVYIEARRTNVRLAPAEQAALDKALNDWLAVYAAHHGYVVDPDVPVREAAEAFLDTHNIQQTAAVLTGVPKRES